MKWLSHPDTSWLKPSLLVLKPEYSRAIRSISWLLMPWRPCFTRTSAAIILTMPNITTVFAFHGEEFQLPASHHYFMFSNINAASGPWFSIKMSYQHGKCHCGDKTVVRPSYLHKGISCSKMTSLYWIKSLEFMTTPYQITPTFPETLTLPQGRTDLHQHLTQWPRNAAELATVHMTSC